MTVYGDTVKTVMQHVVLIRTPRGSGTGFLFYRGNFVAIATATHVISTANYWGEPIDIIHQGSGTSQRLLPEARAIETIDDRDIGYVAFTVDGLQLPPAALPLIGPKFIVETGTGITGSDSPQRSTQMPHHPPSACSAAP